MINNIVEVLPNSEVLIDQYLSDFREAFDVLAIVDEDTILQEFTDLTEKLVLARDFAVGLVKTMALNYSNRRHSLAFFLGFHQTITGASKESEPSKPQEPISLNVGQAISRNRERFELRLQETIDRLKGDSAWSRYLSTFKKEVGPLLVDLNDEEIIKSIQIFYDYCKAARKFGPGNALLNVHPATIFMQNILSSSMLFLATLEIQITLFEFIGFTKRERKHNSEAISSAISLLR